MSNHLTEQQLDALGRSHDLVILYRKLIIGHEYLVLGLEFEVDPRHHTTGPYVHILLDDGDVVACDLGLFAVTDSLVSRYWQASLTQFEGTEIVRLMPPGLVPMLTVAEDDTRDSLEQEVYFEQALHSSEFRQIVALLQEEQ